MWLSPHFLGCCQICCLLWGHIPFFRDEHGISLALCWLWTFLSKVSKSSIICTHCHSGRILVSAATCILACGVHAMVSPLTEMTKIQHGQSCSQKQYWLRWLWEEKILSYPKRNILVCLSGKSLLQQDLRLTFWLWKATGWYYRALLFSSEPKIINSPIGLYHLDSTYVYYPRVNI